MPKINKKKTKALTQKPHPKSKLKHSVAYYECCASETKKGLICHHCKHNSQKLSLAKSQERAVEKQKIAQAWKQIGISLSKIIE